MSLPGPGLRLAAVGLILGLAIPTLAGAAHAEESANATRMFQLRDGSSVHGQLVEYVPGERVVLLLDNGRVKSIGWAELALATSDGTPQSDARRLPVTVHSDRPVEIVEQDEAGNQPVLSPATTDPSRAPAVAWLHKGGEFRVGGPGVTREAFQLPQAGAVKVDIITGSRSRSRAGIGLVTAGAVLAGGGLVLLLGAGVRYLGAAEDSAVGPPGWLPLSKQLLISAGVVLPIGIIGLIAGSVSYVQGKTKVQVSPIYSSAAMRLPGGLLLSARGVEF